MSLFSSLLKIEEEDVLKCLKSLDPNKVVGTDGISAKILRTVAVGISESLTSLFNASLGSGEMPRECKSAHVTPVHKGGDVEIAGNYRPVLMLPVVVKVFEKLVHQQVYAYLQRKTSCILCSLVSGQSILPRCFGEYG